MLANWSISNLPQYMELKKYFNNLIVIKDNFSLVQGEYPDSNTKLCESTLKQAGYEINDFDEINVGACHYAFGAYLVNEKIPFIFWEDGSGCMFNNKESVKCADRSANGEEKVKWCDKMGLYDGNNPCIIKRIGNLNVAKNCPIPENAKHFDVIEEYLNLPIDVRKEIRSFFTDVEDIELPESSILFLTQHLASLKIMSMEDQILIYQIVVDYFFENENIVFKPHPSDILYYGLLFPESEIIREKFPSEFLPEIFINKPKTIATLSSTSIDNLTAYFDDCFSLGNRFVQDFKYIHRYYAAVHLTEYFESVSGIKFIGAMKSVINNMLYKNKNISQNGTEVHIVDDIKEQEKFTRESIIDLLENISESSAVIFINSRQDFCFYDIKHKSLWEHIVPICINKRQCSDEEFYADTEEEVIYFYSKNERMIKLAEDFNYNKKLEHTGLEVFVETLTPEQKRIKVLEGILAATEERLLYYIEKYESPDNN